MLRLSQQWEKQGVRKEGAGPAQRRTLLQGMCAHLCACAMYIYVHACGSQKTTSGVPQESSILFFDTESIYHLAYNLQLG